MKQFLFFFAVITSALLSAQTHTFTSDGGTTDWHTAANWSANTVPSNSSTVLIPDGFEVNIASPALAQSLTLSGSGTLIVAANILVSETLSIEAVAVLNYEQGNLSVGTLENNGTIRLLTNQQKEIVDTMINNHSRIDFIDSNNIDLSGTVTINNLSDGVMDILANGGLSRQNGAITTLINDGIIKKYTENGDFGNFYMILDVINNNILEVVEDSQLLFLSPQASLHNTSTGILTGTGVFDITSSFLNEGTVSPGGDEIGELSFINTFNLNGGKLRIDILDENNFDTLNIVGSPNLNGDFEVVSSYLPPDYFTVDVLNAQFTIGTCNFPEQTVAQDNSGTVLTYDVICETNKVSLELIDGFIFSVEENNFNDFTISPNPIKQEGLIALDLGLLSSPQLALFDTSGKKVKTIDLILETTFFNRGTLADGIYFAQLLSEGKVITTEKLILK